MDAISVEELSRLLRGNPAPVLLDVRRDAARVKAGAQIAGAIWHDPAHWLDWKDRLVPSPGPVVLYCAHGLEISQGLAAALRAMGVPAFFLQGGFAGWQAAGGPGQALTGATPFDIPGVALSHVGPLCSFDAFLESYDLQTPALRQLADIVRGADTERLDLTPQSAGLYALSLGLSKRFADDQEML